MNAQADAYHRLGEGFAARVLEPSPPAVNAPPWFADDPVARGDALPGRTVVSPVRAGDLSWDELAVTDPTLAEWCADRWLGAYRRLGPPPAELAGTRLALHRLAERVISPARRKANGKIGLRYTHGGFGTPFFGADVQIRVDGTELVVQTAKVERRTAITTLAAAGEHVGRGLLAPGADLDRERLVVDAAAAAFLGDWFGFAASVLEQLRAEAADSVDPSRVQLWPEHFDVALELGPAAGGARAAYGLSPGDAQHVQPYLYVAPWVAPPAGELWQAAGFSGAELPYRALLDAADQRETALAFFRARLRALVG